MELKADGLIWNFQLLQENSALITYTMGTWTKYTSTL